MGFLKTLQNLDATCDNVEQADNELVFNEVKRLESQIMNTLYKSKSGTENIDLFTYKDISFIRGSFGYRMSYRQREVPPNYISLNLIMGMSKEDFQEFVALLPEYVQFFKQKIAEMTEQNQEKLNKLKSIDF